MRYGTEKLYLQPLESAPFAHAYIPSIQVGEKRQIGVWILLRFCQLNSNSLVPWISVKHQTSALNAALSL